MIAFTVHVHFGRGYVRVIDWGFCESEISTAGFHYPNGILVSEMEVCGVNGWDIQKIKAPGGIGRGLFASVRVSG